MSDDDDTIQVFTNNKCTQSIMYREHVYRHFRTNCKTRNKVWRCTVKKCSAMVTTDPEVRAPLNQNKSTHNHGPTKVDVLLKKLRWEAKQEARANATVNPGRYLEEQLQWTVQLTYVAHAMRRMMYRERQKGQQPAVVVPPEPMADLMLRLQRCAVTLDDGQQFVHVVDTGPVSVVVVTCASNLLFLRKRTDAVFVDVTFTSLVTARFPRAYTVHGVAGSRCVPLAYCYVPPGTTTAESWTRHLWTTLDRLCRDMAGGPFAPALLLLAELSPAVHAAAVRACPGTTVRASRYHVARAWDARIYTSPVLRDAFRHPDTPPGRWLRSFLGLPYLPAEMVTDAFVALIADCPGNRPSINFADYVLNNYIENDGGFTPDQWAQQPGDCDPNAAVRYFGRSKRRFRVPMSDIFHSIELLKRKQEVTDSVLEMKKQTKNNDGCIREIDDDKNFVSHVFSRLTANEISLKNYLEIVGTKFSKAV